MKLWFKGQIESIRRFIVTTFAKFWGWLKQWLFHPIATYKERQFKNRRPVIHRSFDKRKLQYLVASVIIIAAVIVFFSASSGSSKRAHSGATVTPSSSQVSTSQSTETSVSSTQAEGSQSTQNDVQNAVNSGASKAKETTSSGLKITGDSANQVLSKIKTLVAGSWRRLGIGIALIGAAILVLWDSTGGGGPNGY